VGIFCACCIHRPKWRFCLWAGSSDYSDVAKISSLEVHIKYMSSAKCNSTTWKSIRRWIELGESLPIIGSESEVEWNHIQEFLGDGEKILAIERKRMKELLKSSSDKFRPLCDPLQIEFGTHRWLAREREEAYSDWMKWILEQLSDPRLVGKVLGVKDNSLRRLSGEIKIGREVGIEAIDGQRRRTDLDISFGRTDTFRVEVKKGDAGLVEADQLRAQECGEYFKHYVLIVSSGEVHDYTGSFTVRYWKDVCQELRRSVRRTRLKQKIVVNAMLLGFVGAVEQNLLGFPGNLNDLDDGRMIPISVADHIERSL
jgi:hypothetical protein